MNREPTKIDKTIMALFTLFFVFHAPVGKDHDHDERDHKIVLKQPKQKAEHKYRKIFHLPMSPK